MEKSESGREEKNIQAFLSTVTVVETGRIKKTHWFSVEIREKKEREIWGQNN